MTAIQEYTPLPRREKEGMARPRLLPPTASAGAWRAGTGAVPYSFGDSPSRGECSPWSPDPVGDDRLNNETLSQGRAFQTASRKGVIR